MQPDAAPVVARYEANLVGRDYVVGDIHGCFEGVATILEDIGFDPDRDRLFCVGDLIDRGELSHRALDFLKQPWVHVVRGNHEDFLVQLYQADVLDEGALVFNAVRNGCRWWLDLSEQAQQEHIAAFAAMPVAIEIASPKGRIGIVHADVPDGMPWDAFTRELEAGNDRVRATALWGRKRLAKQDQSGVQGLRRLFVGHSICDRPTRLGNVHFIDTGAYLGILEERLTVVDLASTTTVLSERFVTPAAAEPDAFSPG